MWPENLSSSEVLAPLLPDPDAFPLDKDMDGALDVGVAAKAILRKQTRLKKGSSSETKTIEVDVNEVKQGKKDGRSPFEQNFFFPRVLCFRGSQQTLRPLWPFKRISFVTVDKKIEGLLQLLVFFIGGEIFLELISSSSQVSLRVNRTSSSLEQQQLDLRHSTEERDRLPIAPFNSAGASSKPGRTRLTGPVFYVILCRALLSPTNE